MTDAETIRIFTFVSLTDPVSCSIASGGGTDVCRGLGDDTRRRRRDYGGMGPGPGAIEIGIWMRQGTRSGAGGRSRAPRGLCSGALYSGARTDADRSALAPIAPVLDLFRGNLPDGGCSQL